MKPGIISVEHLAIKERLRICDWIQANGCRHHIPIDARIIFTGTRLIIPTFDVERLNQKRTKWTRSKWVTARDGHKELPTKTRTYHVRVPLGAIK